MHYSMGTRGDTPRSPHTGRWVWVWGRVRAQGGTPHRGTQGQEGGHEKAPVWAGAGGGAGAEPSGGEAARGECARVVIHAVPGGQGCARAQVAADSAMVDAQCGSGGSLRVA